MNESILTLKTDQELVTALKGAAQQKQSAGELFEQRVSFVYSSVGSKNNITRERVRELVREHEGGVIGAAA